MGKLRALILGCLLVLPLAACQSQEKVAHNTRGHEMFAMFAEGMQHFERADELSSIPEDQRSEEQEKAIKEENLMGAAKITTSMSAFVLLLSNAAFSEVTPAEIAAASVHATELLSQRETGKIRIYQEKSKSFMVIEILDYVGSDEEIAVLRYRDGEVRPFWLVTTRLNDSSLCHRYLTCEISVDEIHHALIEDGLVTSKQIEKMPSLEAYQLDVNLHEKSEVQP